MLKFLDILLFALHLIVIVFNLTGWIWQGTRRLHLWVIGLTGASWFIFGIWYGWGYCFITDWHWNIKKQLGVEDLPNSFIQYFFEAIGIGIAPNTTDTITLVAFIMAVVISIYFNFFRKP